MLYLAGQRRVFLKVVIWFGNFGYDFGRVGGDDWVTLQTCALENFR
jgi:hypothetical protein